MKLILFLILKQRYEINQSFNDINQFETFVDLIAAKMLKMTWNFQIVLFGNV